MIIGKAIYDGQLLDITGAKIVQVDIRKDRKTLWVNVDGVCILRVCQIEEIIDGRWTSHFR